MGNASSAAVKRPWVRKSLSVMPTATSCCEPKPIKTGNFPILSLKKTEMHIELIAGMGHKAEWTIPLEELGDVADASDSGTASEPAPVKDAAPVERGNVALPDTAQLESVIEESVNRALDKKLRPMMSILADLEDQGPSVSDILGESAIYSG